MSSARKRFGKIYNKYINQIFRFIFLKTSSQEIAEDLTSEVFLKAFNFFKNNNNKIKNERAFLYKTARNIIIDFYRNRARNRSISIDDYKNIPDEKQDLEKKVFLDSRMKKIRVALANINPDYQDVILMRYIDGLSVLEIADALDKSESAVRVSIHRALNSLRKELEKTQEA